MNATNNTNKPARSTHIPSTRPGAASGSVNTDPDPNDAFFRPGSPSSNAGVGGGWAISPPGGRPAMTLVSPSYKEACSARDDSRARFERHDPGSDLGEVTVRNDTEHLGRTVGTVRNYLNAINLEMDNGIEALDAKFSMASANGTDITGSLDELNHVFAKVNTFVARNLDPSDPNPMRSYGETLLDEAVPHMAMAKDASISHDTRCTSAQAALRLLGQARDSEFQSLDRHMREAEANHADMVGTIAAQGADIFQSQGSGVLRSLDYVLQHGSGSAAAPPQFDMDGFVQLLYSKNALGSTISSAASRYSVSVPEIRDFVGNISDTDTQQTADEVATEMFGARDNIDFGSYLREVMNRVAESAKPTAQDALKEAMKHMRPITRGDANIHGTP